MTSRETGGLTVGDAVVYASHGIGLVEARQPGGGDLPETLVIAFASGLRVTLPIDQAGRALRPLSGEAELEDVGRVLGADPSSNVEPWSRRLRETREKVSTGDVIGLAEVVRDGAVRERRLPVGAGGRSASASSERGLYLQARALLAAEIARVRGIDTADADAWILEQTGAAN